MAKNIVADVRFLDASQQGQPVDPDLFVELLEDGVPGTPKETRTIGSGINTSILETTDSQGTFYITVVDVESYTQGPITAKWYARQGGTQLDTYPFEETIEYPLEGSLTASSLKTQVLTRLGFPGIIVELDSSQVNSAITTALRLYNRHTPLPQTQKIDLADGIHNYPLPQIGPRGPATVEFVRKTLIPGTVDPLFSFGRALFPGQVVPDFQEFVMGTSYLKSFRSVIGSDPEWQWKPDERTLYITTGRDSAAGGMTNYYAMATYFRDYTLSEVPPQHHHWFERYVLALCKEILGRQRGLFSGSVPTPGGGATLDSATLLDEAKAEQEKAEEEVKGFQPQAPLVRG